jgi:hypothetical protein
LHVCVELLGYIFFFVFINTLHQVSRDRFLVFFVLVFFFFFFGLSSFAAT